MEEENSGLDLSKKEVKKVEQKAQDAESNIANAKATKVAAEVAAGAYFGKTGAKAVHYVGNTRIGGAVFNTAGKAVTTVNKIAPMGKRIQGTINKVNRSGLTDAADKVAGGGMDLTKDELKKVAKEKAKDDVTGQNAANKSNIEAAKEQAAQDELNRIADKKNKENQNKKNKKKKGLIGLIIGLFTSALGAILLFVLFFVLIFGAGIGGLINLTEQLYVPTQSNSSSNNGGGYSVNPGATSSHCGGRFVNYYQYNYNDSYGFGTTIASSGCGPTSMAMVLTYYLNRNISPVEAANYALQNGHRRDSVNGTWWSFFPAIAYDYGLNESQIPISVESIKANLNNCHLIIMAVSCCTFTTGGHFIVLTGVDENGNILVADPNSESRSHLAWDPNIFIREGLGAWEFSI